MRAILAALILVVAVGSANADTCSIAKSDVDSAQTTEQVAAAVAMIASPKEMTWFNEQGTDSLPEAKSWANKILTAAGCE